MTDQTNGEPAGSANVTSLSSDAAAEMIMAMEDNATEEVTDTVTEQDVATPETEEEVEAETNDEAEAETEDDNTADEGDQAQEDGDVDEGEENNTDEIEAYDLDKISGDTPIRLRDGTVVTGAELKAKIDLYNQAEEVRVQNEKAQETLRKEAAEFEQQRLQYEQEAKNFSQVAPVAYQQLKASLPKVPDMPTDQEFREDFATATIKQAEHLRARDEFNRKYAQMEQIKQQAQTQYQSERNKVQEQQNAEAAKANEAARKEGEKLIEQMPELRDNEKREQFKDNLVKGAMKHFGYSEDDLGKLASARDVIALHNAIQNAELKANPPKAASKTKKTTRKAPLAGGARRENSGETAAKEKSQAFAKVRQTGRIEDAAALIANLD